MRKTLAKYHEELDRFAEQLEEHGVLTDPLLLMGLYYAVEAIKQEPLEFWKDGEAPVMLHILSGIDGYIRHVGYPEGVDFESDGGDVQPTLN